MNRIINIKWLVSVSICPGDLDSASILSTIARLPYMYITS